jgi:fluoride exporter
MHAAHRSRRKSPQPVVCCTSAIDQSSIVPVADDTPHRSRYTKSMSIILIFLGGGIGSVLRYLTGTVAAKTFGAFTLAGGWPWGTFLVNLIGCFIMGLCFRLLPVPDDGPANARLLLMTGVLGGFTTFSAFALDAAQLWMRQDGQGLFLYLAGSVVCALAGVALGLTIGKALSP